MASRAPTSNHISESTIIFAPLASVWHFVKLGPSDGIPAFWSRVIKAREYDGQRSDDVQTVVWTLREPDGSERDYVLKLDEHSVLTHSIAFSVVDAQPPVPYSSKTVHVQCSPVTIAPAGMPTDTTSGGGAHSNCTFIQWGASFSSDATVEHLELMRNNIKSTFEDLNKAAMKHAATHASTNAGPNKGAGAALASKASSAAAQLSQNV